MTTSADPMRPGYARHVRLCWSEGNSVVRIGGDDLKEHVTQKALAPRDDVVRMAPSEEELVVLENATLHSFKLMSTGLGFEVYLTVPLSQNTKLPALTMALQRVVDVHVVRYSRKRKRAGEVYDFRDAYEGTDDG